jgi:hypothetical protein
LGARGILISIYPMATVIFDAKEHKKLITPVKEDTKQFLKSKDTNNTIPFNLNEAMQSMAEYDIGEIKVTVSKDTGFTIKTGGMSLFNSLKAQLGEFGKNNKQRTTIEIKRK